MGGRQAACLQPFCPVPGLPGQPTLTGQEGAGVKAGSGHSCLGEEGKWKDLLGVGKTQAPWASWC